MAEPQRSLQPSGVIEGVGAYPGDIKSIEVMLTPILANQWLLRNTHNRNLVQSKVSVLKGALERGEWSPSNDAICFDYNGRLINGQHRAAAVVASGVPIQVTVRWNLPPESQRNMDRGTKRTFAGDLQIEGVPHSTMVAGATKYLWVYEEYPGSMTSARAAKATSDQLMEKFEQHPGLINATAYRNEATRELGVGPGLWCFLTYLFSGIDPDGAELFMHSLATGENINNKHPVFYLRKKLIKRAVSQAREKDEVAAAWIIKAWNAYRKDSVAKRIGFDPSHEDFPRAK